VGGFARRSRIASAIRRARAWLSRRASGRAGCGYFLGEPALRFHHALIRDAAYRRLLRRTRAELHERLADWIAARAGGAPEHDELLGRHLEQAHAHLKGLGPLDAHGDSLGVRAARHLGNAGRLALARDDLRPASDLLGRALACLESEDPARADLALDWCEALLSAGEVDPAARALAELGRFTAGSDRLRAWHAGFAGELRPHRSAVCSTRRPRRSRRCGRASAAGDPRAKPRPTRARAARSRAARSGSRRPQNRALAAARRARDRRRVNSVLAGAPVAALFGPSPVARERPLLTCARAAHHPGCRRSRPSRPVSGRVALRGRTGRRAPHDRPACAPSRSSASPSSPRWSSSPATSSWQ
jgi:hypothetical protein